MLEKLPQHIPITMVLNKSDLHTEGADNKNSILVSAKSGEGIDELRKHLCVCAGFEKTSEGALMARRRHIDALLKAQQNIKDAHTNLITHGAGELAAEELRLAQEQINQITGEFTSDDLLGEIFSRFCIGK